jgi:hypothetical protein
LIVFETKCLFSKLQKKICRFFSFFNPPHILTPQLTTLIFN